MSKTKRLRNPTRAQKIIMAAAGLDWKNWYVQEEDPFFLTVISKKVGRKRILHK
mgnify:FL=1